jgi:DNA-binding transcriptional ArsR family regulator
MDMTDLLERSLFEVIASALLCHTRRRILVKVEKQWMSVGEIARGLKISSSTISYHISILQRSGLVRVAYHGRETLVRGTYKDFCVAIQRVPIEPIPVHVDDDVEVADP